MPEQASHLNQTSHETQYHAFRHIKQEKKLRNREAALALGISEGEAIANAVGREAIRLRGPFHDIIAAVPRLGRVMALTRNEGTVHEKIGTYENVSYDHVGMVLGPAIDMRIFYSHWQYGYAVTEQSDKGAQHSLQFYDASGTAVHKIHLKEFSNLKAWHWLVEAFEHPDQSPGRLQEQAVTAIAQAEPVKPDSEIDRAGFSQAWLTMQDTHDFFMVLKKYGVTRLQAMRLAPAEHAYQVDNIAVKQMLETAAGDATSIMCFVGNAGNIQIHTGPIHTVKEMGPWINVLDDDFNLHLRMDMIAQSWVVKKPTVDGMVTSLELYDATGEMMAQFFGARKPGKPELAAWRNIVSQLVPAELSMPPSQAAMLASV